MPRKKPVPLRARIDALEKRLQRETARRKRAERTLAETRTKLQERTEELTRSAAQLTALADIGRAVGSSLDLDTVLSTIVARAVQLAGADGGTIYEYDETGAFLELRVTTNPDEEFVEVQRAVRLRRGEGAVGRAVRAREPIQVADITIDGAYDSQLYGGLVYAGTRALLAVPVLREKRILGGLAVSRRMPGKFSPDVVAVLKTLAAQSALAMQTARLLREVEAKGP